MTVSVWHCVILSYKLKKKNILGKPDRFFRLSYVLDVQRLEKLEWSFITAGRLGIGGDFATCGAKRKSIY